VRRGSGSLNLMRLVQAGLFHMGGAAVAAEDISAVLMPRAACPKTVVMVRQATAVRCFP
jgi:hypothetical protein